MLGRPEAELMAARREGDRKLKGMATGVMHLAYVQIIIGALVAGIDAGRNYPDWPLMAGGVTPPGMWALEPWWRNLFENDGTVQFIHRIAGYLLLLVGLAAWAVGRRSARTATRGAFNAMMMMMVLQVVLGIVTVLYSAPWYFAIAHQFGAVVLIVLILRARFLSMYPVRQSVRATA
jgi:cytochrome c oxidase assembly protein subunit 15